MRRLFLIILALALLSSPLAASSGRLRFSALDLDGNAVDDSIFSHAPLTMVFVWSTTCRYCIREMPSLVRMLDLFRGKLQVIGIVVDVKNANGTIDEKQVEKAKGILERNKLSAASLIPSPDLESSLLSGLMGVPVTYYVDGEGYLVGGPIYGAQAERKLKTTIAGLLQ